MRPLVLLSGGMDSTVCLYAALEKTDDVVALGFDYGQTHRVELERAAEIASNAGVPFATLGLPDLGTPSVKGSPVVPNRNAVFLSVAAAYALQRKRDIIVLGACKTDHQDFPDCRPKFLNAFEEMLHAAGYLHLAVWAPLGRLDKAEVWALADRLGILSFVREITVSCYLGYECGKCGACKAREAGYAEYLRTKDAA